MPNQDIIESEHEKVLSMLPWYVNQTLDSLDVEMVTEHIDRCKQCHDEVRFLRSINQAIQREAEGEYAANSHIGQDFASVMARIDAQKSNANIHVVAPSSLFQKARCFFDFEFSLSTVQWGGAAMAGLLVAVLGVQVFNEQSSNDYTVLSSATENDAAIQLVVRLVPEQSWDEVVLMIRENNTSRGWQLDFLSDEKGNPLITVGDTTSVSELSKMVAALEEMESIERVEVLP